MALSIGELVVFTLTSFFFFGRVSRETQNICRYQTLKAEVESKTIRTISLGVRSKQNKKTYNFMTSFYGWGSVVSRATEPLKGDNLLFNDH